MSEYSGFILVNRNKLGPYILSDVTGCRKTQVSDCASSTVFTIEGTGPHSHKTF